MKPILVVLVSVSFLLPVAVAQTGPEQKILTNQDIAVLAKAGFTEDFIINTILTERSRFDTSTAGLAELAQEGLNERVVRAIALAVSENGIRPAPQQTALSQSVALSLPQAGVYAGEMVLAGPEERTHVRVVSPSHIGLAIATQTPYYESTSLFGIFRRRVSVGLVPRASQIITPQFGSSYNSSRMMANFPTLVSPAGSRVHYVVIP